MGVLKHTGTALMLPLLLASLVTGKREPRRKCEPITIPMCSSIGKFFSQSLFIKNCNGVKLVLVLHYLYCILFV